MNMGIRYPEDRIGRPREIGGRHVRKGREGSREGGPEDPRQAHRVRAGHGPEDAEAQGSLDHFFDRFKGVSTRRLHSCLMWFKWLHEATRIGDGASLMRGQPEDVRYRKTWKKMIDRTTSSIRSWTRKRRVNVAFHQKGRAAAPCDHPP